MLNWSRGFTSSFRISETPHQGGVLQWRNGRITSFFVKTNVIIEWQLYKASKILHSRKKTFFFSLSNQNPQTRFLRKLLLNAIIKFDWTDWINNEIMINFNFLRCHFEQFTLDRGKCGLMMLLRIKGKRNYPMATT